MSAEVEKRRKPDGVSNPQQIELLGDRPVRIEPGIFRGAPPIISWRTVTLSLRSGRSSDLERVIHQIEFYGEKLAVDFVDQFMAFQHQMPLRPDCTGINLILRLNQRHDNVVSAFEDLPDVRRPSTPLGEIAGVNDKACCIFLAILSGDNLMTRNQKENVASGQFDLALDEFDIVTRACGLDPTLQVWIDRMRGA